MLGAGRGPGTFHARRLEVVTVTTQKTEQSLIDVPINISVTDQELIDHAGDFSKFNPEEQASIVEHYWLQKFSGKSFPSLPTVAQLEPYARQVYKGASRPSIAIKGRQRFTDLSKLKTVRDEIWAELGTLNVEGGTPLGAAYVETMRYMLGMPVFVPLVDPRVTTDATMTQYKSPVKTSSQCGGNYVFALTDGEPNNLANVGVNTKEIIGETCPSNYSDYVYGNGMVENWRCMLAAAEWGASGKNQV